MARTATAEPKEERAPVTAVGYDANGETVDVPVDTRPAGEQSEMPGFEAPELWGKYEGRLITKVLMAIGGECDLSEDVGLARAIRLREEITVTITGTIIGKAYKTQTDKNGVVTTYGTATLKVTELHGGEAREGSDFYASDDDEDSEPEENDLASSLAAAGVE